MNPNIRAIFEANGCEVPTEAPPAEFAEPPNPVDVTSDFSQFNSRPLYQAAGEPANAKTKDEKYLHMRQYYLNQVRSASRSKLIEEHLEKIRHTLTEGTLSDIQELYKQRHIWRQKAHEIREDDKPICLVDDCIHIALPGSPYCINHIMQDPNQKLFVECPKCKRPYPVCSTCFTCR